MKSKKTGRHKYLPWHSTIKWNGEINFGHLLTIMVVIIAAVGLYYQKRNVDTRVKDLEAVVNDLETEKKSRELLAIESETKIQTSFSDNLKFSIDQFRANGRITDHEFILILNEINNIIDIIRTTKKLDESQTELLTILKNRNQNKLKVFIYGSLFTNNLEQFEKKNKPIESNYSSIDDYNLALKVYNDTLSKEIKHLLNVLDSNTKEPILHVQEYERKYFDLYPIK